MLVFQIPLGAVDW